MGLGMQDPSLAIFHLLHCLGKSYPVPPLSSQQLREQKDPCGGGKRSQIKDMEFALALLPDTCGVYYFRVP